MDQEDPSYFRRIGSMLDELQVSKDDRERVLDLCVELMIEAERIARAEHGAQILETILGLRYQDDGCDPVGDDQARDRLAAILTTAGSTAHSAISPRRSSRRPSTM